MEQKGFTIIELIISIFILSIGVVGVFSAFSVMTILTAGTSDQLTAAYLAQEGMEIVRNIRDTNWLNMDACSGETCDFTWVDGLADETGVVHNPVHCVSGCKGDYTSESLSPYVATDYLNIDAHGFYSYGTGTQTKFIRKIIITPVTDVDNKSDHIIKVVAQVFWDEKATILNPGVLASQSGCGAYNCITTEETLYDWYNYVNQ